MYIPIEEKSYSRGILPQTTKINLANVAQLIKSENNELQCDKYANEKTE